MSQYINIVGYYKYLLGWPRLPNQAKKKAKIKIKSKKSSLKSQTERIKLALRDFVSLFSESASAISFKFYSTVKTV